MIAMTYGTMPARELFNEQFKKHVPDGTYRIRNCKVLEYCRSGGNLDLDRQELWELLTECCDGWNDNHEMGDVASSIMTTLGFEWI